jgi:ParB-like chromosome segregation protein Spo0J
VQARCKNEEKTVKKPTVIKGEKKFHGKQKSAERRKLKAPSLSTRKAVAQTAAPAAAVQLAVPSYKAEYIPIDDIKVDLGNRRPVIPKMVETLVTSIRVEGLRSPLWVIKVEDETVLVSGLQRLEAMKVLKWKEVPCVFVEPDKIVARRLQLIENAHRADLTKLERANQTAEWLELVESLERISGEKFQKKPGRPEGGHAKAARTLPVPGKSEDAKRKRIASDRKIGALDPAVQAAAIKAGLDDNTGKLEEIARQKTQAAQLAKVRELAKRGKKSSATDHSAPADGETHFEMMARKWQDQKKLVRADWEKAPRDDKRRYIIEVLQYPLTPKKQSKKKK